MEERIALIDADSLCYFCSKETLEESRTLLDDFIKNIVSHVGADRFILFISDNKYFRHIIYPEYKQNRPPTILKFTKELKEYMKDRYIAFSFEGVEADDLVAYYSYKLKDSIICSLDKDIFKQVHGKHFNYKSFQFSETSEQEAIYFLWYQVLMGDSVDNIKGIPGIGKKKAETILNGATTNEELQNRVFKAYLDYYKNSNLAMHNMQLNFKLVYLLKNEDDFKIHFNTLPLIKNVCSYKSL